MTDEHRDPHTQPSGARRRGREGESGKRASVKRHLGCREPKKKRGSEVGRGEVHVPGSMKYRLAIRDKKWEVILSHHRGSQVSSDD